MLAATLQPLMGIGQTTTHITGTLCECPAHPVSSVCQHRSPVDGESYPSFVTTHNTGNKVTMDLERNWSHFVVMCCGVVCLVVVCCGMWCVVLCCAVLCLLYVVLCCVRTI